MRNLKEYIRKNAVFLGLLVVLLACCGIFGGYMLTQRTSTTSKPAQPEPVEEQKEPSIRSLEANYGYDGAVHVTWAIDRADQELSSLRLYYGETAIGGEMKDLSSFSMAQSVYQFPSGECTFTLKASFSNGTNLEKEVTVFINYVMIVSMKEEAVADGVLLKLTYKYDQTNPVKEPRIKLFNTNNLPYGVTYQETTREQSGNMETAVTTYKISTAQLMPGTYSVTVRWFFSDMNVSDDYQVQINKS